MSQPKKSRTYFVERVPLFTSVVFAAAVDDKGFEAVRRWFEVDTLPEPAWREASGAGAQVSYLEHTGFAGLGVVLTVNMPDLDAHWAGAGWYARLAGLAAHEATHFADATFKAVGEDNPGGETRAYLTQWAAEKAMALVLKHHAPSDPDPTPDPDTKPA